MKKKIVIARELLTCIKCGGRATVGNSVTVGGAVIHKDCDKVRPSDLIEGGIRELARMEGVDVNDPYAMHAFRTDEVLQSAISGLGAVGL